jgi:hypothetical protein
MLSTLPRRRYVVTDAFSLFCQQMLLLLMAT